MDCVSGAWNGGCFFIFACQYQHMRTYKFRLTMTRDESEMVQRIIDAYQLLRTQKPIDAAAGAAGGPGGHIGPPVWWVREDAKEMRVGAETEWVKALPQRGLGVVMATRLHDSLKFAAAHQLGGRAHLGIKDSGIDLGLSAGCPLSL